MKQIFNTKSGNAVSAFLQPVFKAEVSEETPDSYIFVENENSIDDPILEFKVSPDNRNSYEILRKREDLDIDDEELDAVLKEYVLKITEALQNGDDLSAINLHEIVRPYDPEQIRVDTNNYSIKNVYDLIKDGDIDLSPSFQRNLVWDKKQKCRLIESILLRIPLPVFYFASDEEGLLSVVDGLQRLSAIRDFMDNKYPLSDLEYLSDSCNGKFYSKEPALDRKFYRRIQNTQIGINIIDASSPADVKYDVFRRLNTGGKPLNSQELRNCLASKQLREALQEMAHSRAFADATGGSVSDSRMNAQELALRFLLFRDFLSQDTSLKGLDKYSGDMEHDLNDFTDKVSKNKKKDLSDEVEAFIRAMRNAKYLFGKHAFRKVDSNTTAKSRKSIINKAMFVSWSVLLSYYDHECLKQKVSSLALLKPLGTALSEDKDFFALMSFGTNGWKNIYVAFEEAEKICGNFLPSECLIKRNA